jgi:endonuclease YncB( thermonuclease family)
VECGRWLADPIKSARRRSRPPRTFLGQFSDFLSSGTVAATCFYLILTPEMKTKIENVLSASSDVRVFRSGKLGRRLISPGTDIAGRASVIDGDTIEIHGQRIRLWGIDAPESRQRCYRGGEPWRCGTSSANALAGFLSARTVFCEKRDTDRYGRTIAVCKTGGSDVGAWLVSEGWALDYTRYSGGAYSTEQQQAKANQRGMWQGEFVPP